MTCQAAYDAVTLHGWVLTKQRDFIQDREYGLSSFDKCFVASKLVDLLIEYGAHKRGPAGG